MNRLGLSLLAFIALPSTGLARDAEYPSREVLAEFATACGTTENAEATKAILNATGWKRVKDNALSPISRMLARQKGGLDVAVEYGGQYTKQVAGRTLYVLLARSSYFGNPQPDLDCSMFDFEATRLLTQTELAD